MQLTLGTVISRATEMAGGRADYSTSDVSFYVNLAIQRVMDSQTFRRGSGTLQPPEMVHEVSTDTDSRYLGLPSDFKLATSVLLTLPSNSTATSAVSSLVRLRQREVDWMDEQSDRNYPGIPSVYASYGTRLELYPVPDSSYSMEVRYEARHETLVSGSSAIPMEDRWHPAVLYKTVELLYAARQDPSNEDVARLRYLQYMSSTPSDDAWRQHDKRGAGVRVARWP